MVAAEIGERGHFQHATGLREFQASWITGATVIRNSGNTGNRQWVPSDVIEIVNGLEVIVNPRAARRIEEIPLVAFAGCGVA